MPVVVINNYGNLPVRTNVEVPRFLLYFSREIDALARNFEPVSFLQLLKDNGDFVAWVLSSDTRMTARIET